MPGSATAARHSSDMTTTHSAAVAARSSVVAAPPWPAHVCDANTAVGRLEMTLVNAKPVRSAPITTRPDAKNALSPGHSSCFAYTLFGSSGRTLQPCAPRRSSQPKRPSQKTRSHEPCWPKHVTMRGWLNGLGWIVATYLRARPPPRPRGGGARRGRARASERTRARARPRRRRAA